MKLTPNQWTILETLERGPGWMRSFQTVKPLVEDLVGKGLIERCRPHLGRARNMIRLTAAGCTALGIDAASVPAEPVQPKPNSKAFKPVLGPIREDARPEVRQTCEAFARSIANGATTREAVAELAAVHDVQRPAIWKRLRAGGIIAPYAPRRDGGKGRPHGGGEPGWSLRRRKQAIARKERLRLEPSPEQFVDRDPCPRCAVRGDIGCAHHPVPA